MLGDKVLGERGFTGARLCCDRDDASVTLACARECNL
jgi:hypothetical protein